MDPVLGFRRRVSWGGGLCWEIPLYSGKVAKGDPVESDVSGNSFEVGLCGGATDVC